jgi:hypothetical protein
MLESGDKLATWALAALPRDWLAAHARTEAAFPNCPALAPGNEVSADRLGGHRLAFLEYEGALSSNRGRVVRVAEGAFTLRSKSSEEWVATIDDGPFCGQVTLTGQSPDGLVWLLRIEPAG